MDDIAIPGRDDPGQLFKRVIANFGAPAFIRRALRVQEAFDNLIAQCRKQRHDWLPMVRLRLATLHSLAGDWVELRPVLADEAQIDRLRELWRELEPQLKVPIEPSSSARALAAAMRDLCASLELFNLRWS